MKIKINKEQIIYLNGLEDPEAKKDFLINCFLTQCEEEIKKEEQNLLKFDLPKQENGWLYKGKFTTEFPEGTGITLNRDGITAILNNNPSLEQCIEWKNLCASKGEYDLYVKFREKEIQLLEKAPPTGESLSKEKLKEITNPNQEIKHNADVLEKRKLILKELVSWFKLLDPDNILMLKEKVVVKNIISLLFKLNHLNYGEHKELHEYVKEILFICDKELINKKYSKEDLQKAFDIGRNNVQTFECFIASNDLK